MNDEVEIKKTADPAAVVQAANQLLRGRGLRLKLKRGDDGGLSLTLDAKNGGVFAEVIRIKEMTNGQAP